MVEVEVVVQIAGQDVHAGRLWSHRRRGRESQTFAYVAEYLARPGAYALDPALPLVAQPQQTPAGRATFGAFSDAAPDRWGRRLIDRSEYRRARDGAGGARSFGEIDYLLGVRDDLRQGALRFRSPGTHAYLADDTTGVPALVELPALLSAADRLERDEATDADILALFRGGSSLGGARPKAHVLDGNGRIAIAKFPSPVHDDWDVIAWETVTLQLARNAGIDAARGTSHRVDGRSVLVVDRFDRDGDRRIGFASAMTMLEAADGEQRSYLEIAEAIEVESTRAAADLAELWRRIAFSVLVSNTDDHLRNHGFLRSDSGGWRLSPAYDLNPDPRPGRRFLQTALDYDDPAAMIDTVLGVADAFRLGPHQAREQLAAVVGAVREWATVARARGLNPAEIQRMAPAFDHDQMDRAAQLVG